MKKPNSRARQGARVQLAVWIDASVKAALDTIKERDGHAVQWQVERALKRWTQARGFRQGSAR